MTKTAHFLEGHTPALVQQEQDRMQAEHDRAKATAQITANEIMDNTRIREFIANIVLRCGYIGGWKGRTDDFNQGMIYAASMIVDAFQDKKPEFIQLLGNQAAEQERQKGSK